MYRIINNTPISLSDSSVTMDQVLNAIKSTNKKLKSIADSTRKMSLDIFKILDLRTLSGTVGETFVGEMSNICPSLRKNPSIDGYPDLVQCSTEEMIRYYDNYSTQDSKE